MENSSVSASAGDVCIPTPVSSWICVPTLVSSLQGSECVLQTM